MESPNCNLCLNYQINQIYFSCEHHSCPDCFYKICLFNKHMLNYFAYDIEKQLNLKCMLCSSGVIKISKKKILENLIATAKTETPNHAANQIQDTLKRTPSSSFKSPSRYPKDTSKNPNFSSPPRNQKDTAKKSKILSPSISTKDPAKKSKILSPSASTKDTAKKSKILSPSVSTKDTANKSNILSPSRIINKTPIKSEFTSPSRFINKTPIKSEFKSPYRNSIDSTNKLDDHNKTLKDKIKKKVVIIKDQINSIIEGLQKISFEFDKTLIMLDDEIETNHLIIKHLLKKLNKDLEGYKYSTSFSYEYFQYISKNYELLNMDVRIEGSFVDNLQKIREFIDSNKNSNVLPLILNIQNNQIFSRELNLSGHTNTIRSIIQLKDGKLVSASTDKTIRIWENFKCILSLNEYTNGPNSLIELKDGKIATGTGKTIRILDPKNNFKCSHILNEHSAAVISIIQLKDTRMVSCSGDKIKVWDTQNDFKCKVTFEKFDETILCMIRLKDGTIASGTKENNIYILNPNDQFRLSHLLKGHLDYVTTLIQLKDGRIATGSRDMTIRIWDPEQNFKCTNILEGHTSYVSSLIQLKDGRMISTSFDYSIRIWEPKENFKYPYTINGQEDGITFLTLLRDGRLASGSLDYTIMICVLAGPFEKLKISEPKTDSRKRMSRSLGRPLGILKFS